MNNLVNNIDDNINKLMTEKDNYGKLVSLYEETSKLLESMNVQIVEYEDKIKQDSEIDQEFSLQDAIKKIDEMNRLFNETTEIDKQIEYYNITKKMVDHIMENMNKTKTTEPKIV